MFPRPAAEHIPKGYLGRAAVPGGGPGAERSPPALPPACAAGQMLHWPRAEPARAAMLRRPGRGLLLSYGWMEKPQGTRRTGSSAEAALPAPLPAAAVCPERPAPLRGSALGSATLLQALQPGYPGSARACYSVELFSPRNIFFAVPY